jgi:uncharacterized protein (DUF2252 family)
MTSVLSATRAYEAWLKAELEKRHLRVLTADLRRKHKEMAAGAFPFMRATFYRFVPVWHAACSDLAATPRVLAVGDLHVENFGTWRDAEGRLVWGINDVDETAAMPYAVDLVRLGASALLAWRDGELEIEPRLACRAILKGYRDQLAGGGRPFVLEEDGAGLREAALGEEWRRRAFWQRLAKAKPVAVPPAMRRLLAAHLPSRDLPFEVRHRIAGLGCLGRPRYLALTKISGAYVAREAKAMLASAYGWALGRPAERFRGAAILARAVRCPDPFLSFEDGWQLRRLGPQCSRIELDMLPKRRDERLLLESMGRETANLHLGSRQAIEGVRADLAGRRKKWLYAAAQRMAEATMADWKEWRARR